MKNAILYLLVLVVAIALSVGGYFLQRWWNNLMFYDGATRDVVCEMVKPEYLKEGACK